LWNNYDDRTDGFFPGKDSMRVGKYSPIDLLKNKNGKVITTAQDWWQIRRVEILKDAQQLLYGVPPPDSLLPQVPFKVTTYKGGEGEGAYIQKEISGFIDISRYTQVRDTPLYIGGAAHTGQCERTSAGNDRVQWLWQQPGDLLEPHRTQ
jgi:hypothetical protein